MLADLLSESYNANFEEVWENERMATFMRDSLSCSLLESQALQRSANLRFASTPERFTF
jgi:hypothetical protein